MTGRLKMKRDTKICLLPNCEARREAERGSRFKRFCDWMRAQQVEWERVEAKTRKVPEAAEGELAETFRKLNEAT